MITVVRHPLGGAESERPAGQEASHAVIDEEWQGGVRQSELLSVRPHLRKEHVCEDNGGAMGAKGKERYRHVQEGDR